MVAEGIEAPEQLAALQELGCPLGQGYLLARPLAPEELEAMLTEGGQSPPSSPPASPEPDGRSLAGAVRGARGPSRPQLAEPALLRRLVLAPAQEARAVADAVARDVVERHLAHELGAEAPPHRLLVGLFQRLGSPEPPRGRR